MADYETPLVLAIDIGSSSVKAGLFDALARSVEDVSAEVPHEQDVESDGTVEEPVERIIKAVEEAVDSVLKEAGKLANEIRAVGMDSMASTILGVDSDGRPMTPVYTYADTRSAEDVEQMKREIDVDAVYGRTGVMQHTSYVPGRVRWLQRTQPDVAKKVARWLDVSTFLLARWLGREEVHATYSISSWSGMLDRKKLQWDEGLMQHLGLTAESLPRLGAYSEPEQGLSKEFADRWPALKDVPFFPAVGDGAAVNVGAGCVSPDRVALTVGSTSAMRVLVWGDPPDVPRGLWGYRLGRDASLLGGAFSEGGILLDWAQNVLKAPSFDDLDAELSKLKTDAHGLTILPFLAGERATGWSTRATGVFSGVRVSTTALEMMQAMMESVSLRFAQVAELLPGEETLYVASGGAVRRSTWWLQAMSDALGAPVEVSWEDQETSRGAAVLALHGLGEWKSLDDHMPHVKETYQPRPDVTEVYHLAAERQKDLYQRLLLS